MNDDRILITGIGLVTALGAGRDTTWAGLCAGRSGTGPITKFDAAEFSTRFANQVPADELDALLHATGVNGSAPRDLCGRMLVVAVEDALHDAGLSPTDLGARAGFVVGTDASGTAFSHDARLPYFVRAPLENDASIWPSLARYGPGPRLAVATACASGAHAVAVGYDLVRSGRLDMALVGGVEAAIVPWNLASFNAMLALSLRNDDPTRASRPFDRTRDGFVMGDGAGMMVIERAAAARRRGVACYAEILGYGATSEASSMAVPLEGGRGMARTMEAALQSARLDPSDVDYISAHGTSTPANDVRETAAIKRVFGQHASRLGVSSQKSMLGHTIGAAGAIEVAVTALTVRSGLLTPTINYEEPDPECDLFYVPNHAVERPVRHALSNSFAFGGHNCSVALGRHAA